MKHSQEEILKALHVIKETCDENPCDETCPFNSGQCLIMRTAPNGWKINEAPVQWKGLL